MRLSTYIYAGPHERFAEDVEFPLPGSAIAVNMPDGSRRAAYLIAAERVDDGRIRVTVETHDGAPAV